MASPKAIGGVPPGANHYAGEVAQVSKGPWAGADRLTYTFQNFFHPRVGELIGRLNRTSVAGMLDPSFLQGLTQDFFTIDYDTTHPSKGVELAPFPRKEVDLSVGGPYANYNWELLYHIPVAVAVHLTKNQRFAEAQKWFHLVFDPTAADGSPWRFLGFQGGTGVTSIDELLQTLSDPAGDSKVKQAILAGYEELQKHPFRPHAVARTRPAAYQYYVVMKYLDNLIAWGDSLFLQYTVETINEATLCYVLAANLLGPRPQELPARSKTAPKTFRQLKDAGPDALASAVVELEAQFPFNSGPPGTQGGGADGQTVPPFGLMPSLYFCVPPNQKLLTYWDTVADRLFKIRHCMDITGVVRPLPLFDPPIDPGMLVKAAAAGIDIGSILGGLNQPLGPLRSLPLIEQALMIAGEVRALGNALLSALEKNDAEQLASLRQNHEIALQQMTQNVRFLQWKQAQESTNALLKTRGTAYERYTYHLRLLGLTPDAATVPESLTAEGHELTEDNFDEAHAALVTAFDRKITLKDYPKLDLAGGSSPSDQAGASGTGKLNLNVNEDAELNSHLPAARDLRLGSGGANLIASSLTPIPSGEAHLAFWGIGVHSNIISGQVLGAIAKIAADVLQIGAANETDQAGIASRTASYQRSADDRILQANLAARELMQIGQQIIGSAIAEQVALHEYKTAQTQVGQSQEVLTFLQGQSQTSSSAGFVPGKVTTLDLYGWMQGELSRLYYQYYRFAVDTARKAERTMKQELMRPELDATDFIQFNYWDSGRQGLLSGEALYLDLKRMEMAYHDNNKRELELTRHISLRQLDPLALLNLKITGSCTFTIPEWLYDRDCPGHYLRRIKTVAVSIPSVVGPYASINCTATLLRSTVRVSPLLNNGTYARDPENEDDRFADYFGSVQSIVTSGATNDSGMFETNLRDERFLPFEGAGAVSTWSLALPSDLPPFDYTTISDVILHVRYTARDGGALLGGPATKELKDLFSQIGQSGLVLLFNLRYDFPTEWSAFVNGTGAFAFTLRKEYFPYFVQSQKTFTIDGLVLYGQNGTKINQATQAVPDNLSGDLNGPTGASVLAFPADPTILTRNQAAQVFLILQYHLGN
jgi:hypothetical protein